MYIIRVVAYCPDERTEILPDSPDSAECVVEESISLRLLELFGNVYVDSVEVEYLPCKMEEMCGDAGDCMHEL